MCQLYFNKAWGKIKKKKKNMSRKRLSQDLTSLKMLWWRQSCLTHLSGLTDHRLEEWIPWCPWVCLECWLLHCLPGGLKPTASLLGHQLPSSVKGEWEPLTGGLGWEEEALISGRKEARKGAIEHDMPDNQNKHPKFHEERNVNKAFGREGCFT